MDLRSSRQRKGVSLEQIAEATKISIRFLRAIEAEEFEKLPGGIFATSYLRQYAGAVGADENGLVQYYHSKTSGEVEGAREIVVSGDRGRNSLLRFWREIATAGR